MLTELVIPDGVTSIGSHAFRNCSTLTSVVIPNSVTSIGSHAFSGCSSLTSIIIPECVTRIGWSTFSGCSALTNVSIPGSVTIIEPYAFYNCSSMESVSIPGSVTSIGYYAFFGCSSLLSVEFGAGVMSIGDYVFKGCSSLTSVYAESLEGWLGLSFNGFVSNPMDYAENLYIDGELLTELVIPDNVTNIGHAAFRNCGSLTSVVISDSVNSIGASAFEGCSSLFSVDIGNSVTSIGYSTFANCSRLEKVIIRSRSDNFTVAENAFTSSPVFYCYELTEADIWAYNMGYTTVPLDDMNLDEAIEITMPEDCRLAVGQKMDVVPNTFPQQPAANIAWVSSAPEIVSMENGVATAHAIGVATITATSGKVSDSMEITVYAHLETFDIPEEFYIVGKTTAQLAIENIRPVCADAVFTWESSDNNIFTVDASGMINALRPGEATLTVTSENGIERECTVYVCYRVTDIAFERSEYSVAVGGAVQLTANVMTGNGDSYVNKLLAFASSDEAVTTVDGNGLVNALSEGEAIITASNGSISTSCAVKVTARVVPSVAAWTLPANLTIIEEKAFMNLSMTEIVIPEQCESIGNGAFAECDELKYAFIPESVKFIADDAFEGCNNLSFVCSADSYAVEYARGKGIACIPD